MEVQIPRRARTIFLCPHFQLSKTPGLSRQILNYRCAKPSIEGADMTDTSEQNHTAGRVFSKARREPRVVAAIVVEVSGSDAAGCFFSEHTSTANFSDNGCCFRVNAGVNPGAFVALQSNGQANLANRPVFYQIVWMEPRSGSVLVGAARLLGESAGRGGFSASRPL